MRTLVAGMVTLRTPLTTPDGAELNAWRPSIHWEREVLSTAIYIGPHDSVCAQSNLCISVIKSATRIARL